MNRSLAELVRSLSDSTDLAATVQQLIDFAGTILHTEHAGITMIHGGGKRFESVGATDDAVRELDQLQYDLREGPCVDAAIDGKPFRSTDLGHDPRWPKWGREAAARGIHSILSIDLSARGRRLGALNLYGPLRRQFDEEDVAIGSLFAYHAGFALAVARNEENLNEAINSRSLIGQAQGILMERFSIEPEQAFNVLQRFSQHSNVRLRTIAERIVATRELPGG